MRMIVEQLVGWRLAGETEVLRENLPQRHFVHNKIPHDQTRARTRAAAVGSQRLTVWAMARPQDKSKLSVMYMCNNNNNTYNFNNIKIYVIVAFLLPVHQRRNSWPLEVFK
jgi:hypothetical protein